MTVRNAVAGIVLCGGRSERMGKPKAFLELDGTTLLGRTVEVLRSTCDRIVLVAAADQRLPECGDVEIVRDPEPDGGPLVGLAAGLRAVKGGYAFVCGCDMPGLVAEAVPALVDAIGEHEVACIENAGRRHPLCAVYRADVAEQVEALVAAGERRMMRLLDACRTHGCSPGSLGLPDSVAQNVNTPEDWVRFLAASR